jgi:acyl dehydratase
MADGPDHSLATALDLSDLDRRVGQRVGGAELDEPCSATDIRRWVMAMDYPNPLHWDADFARASKFAGLVAPQSFIIAMDCGQGVQAALVGHLPGSLLLYGGDEWFFYGRRVRPGDCHVHERRFVGYQLRDTRFAGPSVFASGDTLHRNRDGTPVARQRATVVRFSAAEAERRAAAGQTVAKPPVWSAAALDGIDAARHAWILSGRDGASPDWSSIEVGARLGARVVGPHSVATFTTEQRALPFNIWGTSHSVVPDGVRDPWIDQDPGFAQGFEIDRDAAKTDPRLCDGLFAGPARGHGGHAARNGDLGSRAFGYGASMGAWVNDYLAYWAGHDGFVRHTKVSYRGMAFEGDVAWIRAEVTGKEAISAWGAPLVHLRVEMTNQDDVRLLDGIAAVELPV